MVCSPVMAAKPARTRRNDPQGLRTRILDAAADMFQNRGYNGTSMHDLMDAIGVSGGALHHHFPTKKSLALAIIADRVAPTVRETWIEPVRTSSSLGRGVASVFAGIISAIEVRGSVLGCPLNNLALELALADPELRDAIQKVFAEWQAVIAERIGATRGGARLNRGKRASAAAFIVAVYSGAMNLAKANQSALPLRDAAGALSQWLGERKFAI